MGSGIALGFANGLGAFLVFVLGLWIQDDNITVVFWVLAVLGLISAALALLFDKTLMH